jgi:GTP-binding protein EngB required for normal cell division
VGQMTKETKLRTHNITAKAALKFGSEAWVLKKRDEQRLEAAQMKSFRHLLVFTKLDKFKNQSIRGKNLQFQSSIVDNGRDYVLHYVGMSNMHIFYLCCL